MRKRIRIIYPERTRTFGEMLEARAQTLTENRHPRDPVLSTILSDLELTLDNLTRNAALHASLRLQLLRLECYINTDLMERSPHPPAWYNGRGPERDMLRARLLRIEHERRQLAIMEEDRKQTLHARLLELLQRFDHLS